jgi:hypothetical protein
MLVNDLAQTINEASVRGRQIAIDLLGSARTDGMLVGLKGKSVYRTLERITKNNDAEELAAFADKLHGTLRSGWLRDVSDPRRLVPPAACVRDTGTELGHGFFQIVPSNPVKLLKYVPLSCWIRLPI